MLNMTRSAAIAKSAHRDTSVAPESTQGATAIHIANGMLSNRTGRAISPNAITAHVMTSAPVK
jgi:hypothetical protein